MYVYIYIHYITAVLDTVKVEILYIGLTHYKRNVNFFNSHLFRQSELP